MVKKENKTSEQKKEVKKSSLTDSSEKQKSKRPHKHFVFLVLGIFVLILLTFVLVKTLSSKKVSIGDTVTMEYTGSLDTGIIFDTSIERLGKEAKLPKESYEPFSFVVGKEQVIPGFEKNILGLTLGEKKKFTLTPEEGYGKIREDLIITGLKKRLELRKYSVVPLETYKKVFSEEEPKINAILKRDDIPWNLKIVEVNATSVKLENLLSLHQIVNITGTQWTAEVLSVDDDLFVLQQHPEVGKGLAFPTPNGVLKGVVKAVTQDTFDIDTNPPLAGKSLTFEVEVKDIKREKK